MGSAVAHPGGHAAGEACGGLAGATAGRAGLGGEGVVFVGRGMGGLGWGGEDGSLWVQVEGRVATLSYSRSVSLERVSF